MMKSFQKPANTLQELRSPHPGIIDDQLFNHYFELHCYQPSADLAPFVKHIWVQRKKQASLPMRKPPVEVLSGPNIYLFFTPERVFIHSITRHEFEYGSSTSNVTAGVKFHPGGFYPFLQSPVSEFDADTTPISSVFPAVGELYAKNLLTLSDAAIVATLETLLMGKQPKWDAHLELIAEIMLALMGDTSLKTVRSVARTFHMSERSLQLLFHTYVGANVKWIITRRRLLEAIRQVREHPEIPQIELVTELGYNSQSHFTREFTEVVGQPPSQYLKHTPTTLN
jgi:AraC-like DNA-binding protein